MRRSCRICCGLPVGGFFPRKGPTCLQFSPDRGRLLRYLESQMLASFQLYCIILCLATLWSDHAGYSSSVAPQHVFEEALIELSKTLTFHEGTRHPDARVPIETALLVFCIPSCRDLELSSHLVERHRLLVGYYVWQHFHLSGSIVATSPSSSKTALRIKGLLLVRGRGM